MNENFEERPSYYSIIPASVRYDNDLKPNEKLIYGEITALCDNLGYCWATNEYFAKLYQVSRETVSRWINHLVKKGYLYSEIIYKENSSEILNRILKIDKNLNIDISNLYRKRNIFPIDYFVDRVLTGKSIDYSQNNQGSIDEKIKENNTSINITSINNKRNIKENKNFSYEISQIVDYLNSKTGLSYKSTTKKTRDLIIARFNEGFTLENFKVVIDKKCSEWLDTDMQKYLRPETLFGTKFESYLNQQNIKTVKTLKDLKIDVSDFFRKE